MLVFASRWLSFSSYRHHRHLHSFPTRRSSDLTSIGITGSFKSPEIAPDVGELAARAGAAAGLGVLFAPLDRKSTRLNSSHLVISYAVFCLKKKKIKKK